MIQLIKKGVSFLQNQEIDLRIRMLFLLEYASLVACIFGTIAMISFASSIRVLIPNFMMIIFSVVGLYLSQVKKKYDLATYIIVGGCNYISLPYMFFTAGGNNSGMPIWFLFAVVFTCMMIKGKPRLMMSLMSVMLAAVCMIIGNWHSEWVLPLENSEAMFVDMLQSFLIVSIVICISLMLYLEAYDRQRNNLMKKSQELKETMSLDPLTGIANRHAFYEDSEVYMRSAYRENVTFVLFDINGLKKVNDTQGHAAGDELIINATKVLVGAFDKYGRIYRTGGDEFVGLLSCDDKEVEQLEDILKNELEIYNEKNKTAVSIAIGVASWNQNKEKSFFELGKLADVSMYHNKSIYYKETGRDRRRR